ncbi:MAG: TonB-dependent receptor [Fimbriimonadaceae bacterium]|nr:TonB-dependent receptor [Chitinophagales bacterium]
MKICISVILSLLFICTIHAQVQQNMSGSVVTGKVIDVKTKKPVEFAAVSITKLNDSTILSGAITDAEGKFFLKEITAGNYQLQIQYIGYEKIKKEIQVTAQPPFNNVGLIELKESTNELEKVEIIAEQSYFQNSIDKKVYNVEKDIVASSGNASDVLQTIPSVTIDIDGNISLRGNTGVRIWIDGKPTGFSGSSLNAILEQIPAGNIESVEVVTNPSARYEAEGGAGIINIVMKKNKQSGMNGNITAGISTTPGYEAGIALNYRNPKMNVYSSYTYRHDDRGGSGETFRKTFETDTTFYTNSISASENISAMHMGRGGIDFYLNEKNTLGFSGMIHGGEMNNLNTTYYSFLNADSALTSTSTRIADGSGHNFSYNVAMNYKKIYEDAKHYLSFDANYNRTDMNDLTNYFESYFDLLDMTLGEPFLQNIARPGINTDAAAAIDYVHPFKNGNKFETGFKYTKEIKDNTINSESFDTIADVFVNDLLISNQFIYDEDVFAGYLIWNSSIKKLGYQIGLRAEQTYTNSELTTTSETFENNYFGLFPSAHLAYKLNDKTEFTASYSRRIDRPNSWFLNPFPDYSDPYNLRFGNPFLEPEYENSYEIGFTKYFEKHTIDASLFYEQTLNEISPYITVDSAGISNMTFQNYNSESQYGIELILRSEFYKWWNATGSFNFNQTLVDAQNLEAGLTNSLFNYNIRVMNFFQLAKATSFQVTVSYNTPWSFAQGKSDAVFYADAGLKQDFFKNKLSLNLSMSDIFDTRQWGGFSEGINYYSTNIRKRESQIFTAKLTYKFGQQDNNRRTRSGQEGYDGGNDEMF